LLSGPSSSYRRLLKSSSIFAEKVEAAKLGFILLAKDGLYKRVKEGDGATIRWVLERKKPEEYGRKSEESSFGLPPNLITVLPGSKPHPRVTIDREQSPNVRYAFEME
jgi:hypothetical protein